LIGFEWLIKSLDVIINSVLISNGNFTVLVNSNINNDKINNYQDKLMNLKS
jgi:hypothetical protein